MSYTDKVRMKVSRKVCVKHGETHSDNVDKNFV